MKSRPIRELKLSSDFDAALMRLPKRIQNLAQRKVHLFQADAYDARLKTHALGGKLKGLHSFSVNHSYRILFEFLGPDRALLITIGTHAIY